MIDPPYFFRMDFNSKMFILQRGTEYFKPKLFNRNAYLLSPPIFAATGNCLSLYIDNTPRKGPMANNVNAQCHDTKSTNTGIRRIEIIVNKNPIHVCNVNYVVREESFVLRQMVCWITI